jgi:hypothetical protein
MKVQVESVKPNTILPVDEFAEAYLWHDDVNADPNHCLVNEDRSSENNSSDNANLSKMYGHSLIYEEDNQMVFKLPEICQQSVQPCFDGYLFQQKLEKNFLNKLHTMEFRKLRRSKVELEQNVERKSVDCDIAALIYIYATKQSLSKTGVEDLLKLLSDVSNIAFKQNLNIFNWKPMRKYFDQFANVFSPIAKETRVYVAS